MRKRSITIMILRFSKKQLTAMTWWCRESKTENFDAIICDGAVRSGKTLSMGLGFIFWAMSTFNHESFAFCGKTIRSLWRNLMGNLLPMLSTAGFSVSLRRSENRFLVKKEDKENYFFLFGGKDESSAMLIQGLTLCGVFFDEVALMPRSFVEQALARCSVDNSRFWFNCNPEDPTHWFYQKWIKKCKERNAFYLHFTMDDNPGLSKKVRLRYERLYEGAFYERFIKGRWVCAQGLIYPFMTSPQMIFSPPGVCSEYAVSCDYGTRNPSSFGLWGRKENVWYRVDEYYYDGRQNDSRTDEEHYKALETLCEGKKIHWITVDPSAASFIEVIRRHGKFRVIPAKNDVLEGIRKTTLALKEGKIRICSTCGNTIREFSRYRWQESREAPVKEEDHAMDDIRYFVMNLLGREENAWALALPRGKEDS